MVEGIGKDVGYFCTKRRSKGDEALRVNRNQPKKPYYIVEKASA